MELSTTSHRLKTVQKAMVDIIKIIVHTILFVTLPALVTFSVEWMQLREIQKTWTWITEHPYQILLGYGFVLLFFALLYMIFCRLYVAMLGTSFIFITLAIINYYKIIIRGDPFMPWDLLLQKEAGNIMAYINVQVDQTTITIVGALLLATIISMFFKTKRWKWQYRGMGVIVCTIILAVFMKNTYLDSKTMQKLNIQDIFWNQKKNYETNGFLTGFGMNIKNVIIKAPAGYSENSVNHIIDEYAEAVPAFATRGQKPNIIMIMNEAFWDPTQFEGTQYSTDPIPTIQKIREEGLSGWLLSPQYGGGTANTEFEVLTGNSVSFLPSGSMAYQQYVNKPLGSIASYLKSEGYSTIAIHPYQKWFWDRERVYPYLGFEQFISDENFVNPEKRGQFISDMETMKEIIRQYEKNKGKPFFNYTVTMQNHGPYEDRRYGDNTIQVTNQRLSAKSTDILRTYTEGVKDADQALGYLIDYFKNVNEPTIIVMFGDHLPMLGNDYSVYKEAGYISNGSAPLEDAKKLYRTPLVIWSNYKNEKKDIGTMSANYVGAYVMQYANLNMPMYFQFLNEIRNEVPACINGLDINPDGTLAERPDEKQSVLRQKHWMLQYDLMFGQGYGAGTLFGE